MFRIFHALKENIPYHDKYYRPVTFEDYGRDQVEEILKLGERGTRAALEQGIRLTRELLAGQGYPPHDERIFTSQIPGGMLTNLYGQLSKMGQLDLLDSIMQEIPRVRAMAGYPPLVTPTVRLSAHRRPIM